METNTITNTEHEDPMAFWNWLHERMWEQVELERLYALRTGKEFTKDHPDKIFGEGSLKTPWDEDYKPKTRHEFSEELTISSVEALEEVSALDLVKTLDQIIPDEIVEETVAPKGWDVVDTSVEEVPASPKKPKAKSKAKKKN